MVTVFGINTPFAFAGNPIILRETDMSEYDSFAFVDGGSFTLSYGETVLYSGRWFPPLDFNLSELASVYAKEIPAPPENSAHDVVIEIEDYNTFTSRNLHCEFDCESTTHTFNIIILPGKIPNGLFEELGKRDTDIFQARFTHYGANPFFTTRSSSRLLTIPETEIFPLYFLSYDSEHLKIVEKTGNHVFEGEYLSGLYALDIDALRLHFLQQYGVLSNVFEIFRDEKLSCRLVITKAPVAKNRIQVMFRNSLGVMEIMDLVDEIAITPETEGTEGVEYKEYYPITGEYRKGRIRPETTTTLTAMTGVRRAADIPFIRDMLQSEEVYLIGYSQYSKVKVIPTIENFSFPLRPDSPQNFKIKFEICDTETACLPEDIGYLNKFRVFTDHFSTEFN